MLTILFTYRPSESIITRTDDFTYGTNPIHDVATGKIIGKMIFKYTSQQEWTSNNELIYLNNAEVSVILNDLQNNKDDFTQINSINFNFLYRSIDQFGRIAPGTKIRSKLFSNEITLSKKSFCNFYVDKIGTRFCELIFEILN
jgi:hypothetical protein